MSVAAPPRPPVPPLTADHPPSRGPGPLARAADDAWPRTNRVLPWLIATFVVMVLCTPFDSTELRIALPVDAKLDRLMIVVMTVAWLGALFAGGVAAPRWRRSPVNPMVLAFVAVAVLSLVVNVASLVQEDELNLGLRRFSILLSWAVFFFIVASTIRPREIPAFIKLVLVAGCVCAVGVLYQYWFHRNLFFDWWIALVPEALFEVRPQPRSTSQFVADPITGPMPHALALAAVMAMAMAYALAGLINARTDRSRLWYMLAAVLLLGAVFATGRKTGGFATIGMIVVLLALRPRQMLRFLPLAIIAFGLTFAVRPGAVERQLQQLNPAQVATDASGRGRTEDYRAITPDVRERPLVGKGYGTYDPAKYRILDNEALVLVLEVGFIGLAGFYGILMMVGVVSRRPARSRQPALATAGLAGAGAAGALGVSALLFDTLGFPAPEYAFFFAAGLSVVAGQAARTAQRQDADVDPLRELGRSLEERRLPAEPPTAPAERFRRPVGEPVAPASGTGPLAERQAAREHGGGRRRATSARLLRGRFPRSGAAAAEGGEDGTSRRTAAGRFPRRSPGGAAPGAAGGGTGRTAGEMGPGHRGPRPRLGRRGELASRAVRSRASAVTVVLLALAALMGRGAGDPSDLPTLGQVQGGNVADPFADAGRQARRDRPPVNPTQRVSRRDAESPASSAPLAPAAPTNPTPPVPVGDGQPPDRPSDPVRPRPRPDRERPDRGNGSDPPRPAPTQGPVAVAATEEDCLPGELESLLQTGGVDACAIAGQGGTPAEALDRLARQAQLAHAGGRLSFDGLQKALHELARAGRVS